AMAYDSARQRVVLFGGDSFASTWEWDGGCWTRRSPAPSPAPRGGHAKVYDAHRRRVLLCGGADGRYTDERVPWLYSDAWEWDGDSWTQRDVVGPGVRSGHTMAYDVGRQRVVLFGGGDYDSTLTDTWEWDGSQWAQRTPAVRPS